MVITLQQHSRLLSSTGCADSLKSHTRYEFLQRQINRLNLPLYAQKEIVLKNLISLRN
jgi:hypothetical protein